MNKILKYSAIKLFIIFSTIGTINAQQVGDNNKLKLASGTISIEKNLEQFINKPSVKPNERINSSYLKIIHFSEIPSQETKTLLENSGIQLISYLPSHSFSALISEKADLSKLRMAGIQAIIEMKPDFKKSKALMSKALPSHAIVDQDKIDLNAMYYPILLHDNIRTKLIEEKITIIKESKYSNLFTIRILIQDLDKVAELPYLSFIEPIDAPAEPENLPSRTNHRTNAISSDYPLGRKYDGSGVNIAMGDDGFIGPHVDYQGRVDQTSATSSSGNHGDHVAGIIMGAGNKDPKARGMASGAFLYVYNVWDAINQTPTSYLSRNIRITSTSYGDGCNAGYTTFANTADKQIREMPSLMHVFSCGNSGTSNCGYGAGSNWGNITGGVKIGKNVLAIGNVNSLDVLESSSSRGPAHDGRIKPEVCAVGTNVYSTVDTDSYDTFTGTSMACPGVSGTFAQLYQIYKSLNNGTDPNSALIKCILMNSADDLGNPGPDFKFGFGRINALRAAKIIESTAYFTGSVNQGSANTHTITVPSGTKQLKVMVYWTDYEATANASTALVNNIDMTVVDPSLTSYNPWVLNSAPNATTLNNNAIRGIDNLNNTEQITIDNPSNGNYTINISGTAIPMGPQTYFISYEILADDLTLTYPIGGESFSPSTTEIIRWDAHGNTSTFDLKYSTDNGANWTTISSNIAATARYYTWTVPSVITGNALLRISRVGFNDESDANFSIMGVASGLTTTISCPDTVKLNWNAVNGAVGYVVYKLGSNYMDSVAYTTSTNYNFSGINPNSTNWFSVRAVGSNNAIGERAIAVKRAPFITSCPVLIDASISAVISPGSGKIVTCESPYISNLTIKLENIGSNTLSNIPVSYSVDGGNIITENYTGSLVGGASYNYTFSSPISVSTSGTKIIKTWVNYPGDTYNANDTLTLNFNVSFLSFSLPWKETFDNFTNCSTASTCESITCSLENGFINEANNVADNIDWRTNSGSSPSVDTGPTNDHTLGNASGKYLYLEASSCFNKNSKLTSPCIDLDNTTNPELSFWYHMYGQSMGSLSLDVIADNTTYNNIAPVLSGNKGNQWLQAKVNLSIYSGKTIRLVFRGSTGADYTSDICIDDIEIYDLKNLYFSTSSTSCINKEIVFSNVGKDTLNYYYNFGADATPASASGTGPHIVTYSTSGNKDVKLNAFSATYNDSVINTILVNPSPLLSFNNINALCNNDSPVYLAVSPLGGVFSGPAIVNGYFYPTTSGQGNFDVNYFYTDNKGCSDSISKTILVNQAPELTLSPFDTLCDQSASIILTGGSPLGGIYSGAGILNGTFDASKTGIGTFPITYSLSDSTGCTGSVVQNLTVKVCSSVDEIAEALFSVYPNPAKDEIYLIFKKTVSGSIKIFNSTGQKVISQSINKQNESIHVKSLARGIYILEITSPSEIIYKKLIFQ